MYIFHSQVQGLAAPLCIVYTHVIQMGFLRDLDKLKPVRVSLHWICSAVEHQHSVWRAVFSAVPSCPGLEQGREGRREECICIFSLGYYLPWPEVCGIGLVLSINKQKSQSCRSAEVLSSVLPAGTSRHTYQRR